MDPRMTDAGRAQEEPNMIFAVGGCYKRRACNSSPEGRSGPSRVGWATTAGRGGWGGSVTCRSGGRSRRGSYSQACGAIGGRAAEARVRTVRTARRADDDDDQRQSSLTQSSLDTYSRSRPRRFRGPHYAPQALHSPYRCASSHRSVILLRAYVGLGMICLNRIRRARPGCPLRTFAIKC